MARVEVPYNLPGSARPASMPPAKDGVPALLGRVRRAVKDSSSGLLMLT